MSLWHGRYFQEESSYRMGDDVTEVMAFLLCYIVYLDKIKPAVRVFCLGLLFIHLCCY